MKPLPQTPEELVAALVAIFPTFFEVERADASELDAENLTFHSVMRDFAYFFGKSVHQLSGKQLQQFGEFVARAAIEPGSLGNAIDTCFLEHVKQLKVNRQLSPWLANTRVKQGG